LRSARGRSELLSVAVALVERVVSVVVVMVLECAARRVEALQGAVVELDSFVLALL
jgi:hypothetical protein